MKKRGAEMEKASANREKGFAKENKLLKKEKAKFIVSGNYFLEAS